jgi:hypothetical protein
MKWEVTPMDYRIYSVHGTFAADSSQRGSRWWQRESPFSDTVLSYLDTETFRVIWEPFRWSGENKTSERAKAATALTRVLSQVDHRNNKVALLAHSHGGNIAYSALADAERNKKVPELPVVTVGTPFIPEAHANPWMFEKLPKLGLISTIFLVACLIALWFVEAGTIASKGLAISSLAAIGLCASSLYIKFILVFASTAFRKPGALKFVLKIFQRSDEKSRRKNIRSPKIYSLNDEAINALRAVPSQTVSLATAEIAFLPTALLFAFAVFILGAMVLPQVSVTVPGDILQDFAVISNRMNQAHLSWLNDLAILFVLLVLSTAVGFLVSRLFLAGWVARIFNRLFSGIIKERAYGRDNQINRAMPMAASANLPLFIESYGENEEWRPIPKTLDDDLDEITVSSAIGMFRAIRDTLGMGLTTGSYTFSETLSTNFRGDELVHSAYFEHPDLPGFIAWILCEFYGFPKGNKYSTLPMEKFQEWWDAIRPEPWPMPAEQTAEGKRGHEGKREGKRGQAQLS